jgi:hypothetical protein
MHCTEQQQALFDRPSSALCKLRLPCTEKQQTLIDVTWHLASQLAHADAVGAGRLVHKSHNTMSANSCS